MKNIRSHVIMIPLVSENLVKLSNLINIDIDIGSFIRAEEAFDSSSNEELLYEIIDNPELKMSILFEQYEGICNVTTVGTGIMFNKTCKYLYELYVNSGGLIYKQKEEHFFVN